MRSKLKANFTTMPNAVWRDEALSIDAKGLLAYLLSCPDDWRVSLTHLGRALGTGKDKTQALMRQLISAGYVLRRKQLRAGQSKQFASYDYVVFDNPETGREFQNEGSPDNHPVPQPENPAMGFSRENDCGISAAAGKAVAGKSGYILNTDLTKSKGAADAGAKAPSVSSEIWKEGRELLKQSSSQTLPSIIGKWLKRVPTAEGKTKLLGMIRAAAIAGTADPVSYVTASLAKAFPPLPDAKTFDAPKWAFVQRAAIKTCAWSEAWGPAPGKKGCFMPAHFITPDLNAALSARKIAA